MPIRGRYGFPMQAHEMREQLGVKKLPREAMPARTIMGYIVKVLPQVQGIGRGRSGMKHRIVAECPFCLKYVPFGRLAQHEPACYRKHN
jgi:hypothetical protein